MRLKITSLTSWVERHKVEAGIFLLAFALRFAWLGITMHLAPATIGEVVGRGDGYHDIGLNLLAGNGFSRAARPPFIPDPIRTPLYPLFIAAILGLFRTYWAVVFFQILAGSVVPVLGARIACRIVPSRRVVTPVGILLAVEPLSVVYSFVFITETLFILLFFLFLLLFFDYLEKHGAWRIAGAALLLGLATLTRQTVQYLPVCAALLLLWRGRQDRRREVWTHILILLTVFLVSISPWLYRNYRNYGVVGMSALPTLSVYWLLVPTVLAIEHGTPIKREQEELSKRDGANENDIDLSSSPRFIARSLEILMSHPVSLAKSAGVSLITFFTHDGLLDVLKRAGQGVTVRLPGGAVVSAFRSPGHIARAIPDILGSPAILIVLGRLVWVLVTIAFFAGVFRFLRREDPSIYAVSALFLVAYFAITTVAVGFGIYARYRMPVNVFIFTFALYAVPGLRLHRLPPDASPEQPVGQA
jgi:4-amino-4-deoxy-L-arabinose transferase-like glycosyltransferase